MHKIKTPQEKKNKSICSSKAKEGGHRCATSTVHMKKSSGSGDRPRPISLLPGADFAWVMGVQLDQAPNSWRAIRTRDPIRRHEVLQSVPTSVDPASWRRRP